MPSEVRTPNIGDFSDVEIIEVYVKAGDHINKEDSIVALESDKATMDIPTPVAGTVREVKVKLGDRISEGDLLLIVEEEAGAAAAKEAGAEKPAPEAVQPVAEAMPETRAGPAASAIDAVEAGAGDRAVIAPPSAPPTWASPSPWWSVLTPSAASA